MKVYQAINAVSAQLARDGIGKTGKNQQQGYAFRGIDAVMNALAPLLSGHKLIVFPRMLERQCEARATKSGSVLYSVSVAAEFDFVSAEDGSKHTARTFGEGMDSADKATNKAMSAAYKYAAFMTFCIPVEGGGDHDADATTPEPTGWPQPETPPPPAPAKPPRDDFVGASAVSHTPAPSPAPTRAAPPGDEVAKPTARPNNRKLDTARSRDVANKMLSTLAWCDTADKLKAWASKNGKNSSEWHLVGLADQNAVQKRYLQVKDDIAKKEWQAPPHDPETGEIADSEAAA